MKNLQRDTKGIVPMFTVTVKDSRKRNRTISIVAGFYFQGRFCALLETDAGQQYRTTLYDDGYCACQCPSYRKCYHADALAQARPFFNENGPVETEELVSVEDALIDANAEMDDHIEATAAAAEREAERKMADYRANVAYAILAHENEPHQHKPMPEARTDWENCHGCMKRYYPKYEGQEFCERCDA
jgi:hypothetical protein